VPKGGAAEVRREDCRAKAGNTAPDSKGEQLRPIRITTHQGGCFRILRDGAEQAADFCAGQQDGPAASHQRSDRQD